MTPRTKIAPAINPRPQLSQPSVMLSSATLAGACAGVKTIQSMALRRAFSTGGANANTWPNTNMNMA